MHFLATNFNDDDNDADGALGAQSGNLKREMEVGD